MTESGRMPSCIAHDLSYALGIVSRHVEIALAELKGAEDGSLVRALRAVDYAKALIHIEEMGRLHGQWFTVGAVVDDAVALLTPMVPVGREIHVRTNDAELEVFNDPALFLRILMNLLMNSLQAVSDQGKGVTIEVSRSTAEQVYAAGIGTAPPGPAVRVRVEDDGCGMAVETLDCLFEPGFSRWTDGSGSGMGLTAVRNAVLQMNGAVRVDSHAGVGTRFDIFLPISYQSADKPNG